MEMMRHPDETTNMRRQTVSSYFRVSLFYFYFIIYGYTLLCHNSVGVDKVGLGLRTCLQITL